MAQHDDYQDEEFYEEDFPEGEEEQGYAPAQPPKNKLNPTIIAAGVLGVLAVGGGATYMVAPEAIAALNPLTMLPPEVSALIPGMAPAEEAAPVEAAVVPPAKQQQEAATETTDEKPAAPAEKVAEKPAEQAAEPAAAAPAEQAAGPAEQAAAPAATKPAKAPNDGWTAAAPAEKPKKIAHPAEAPVAKPAATKPKPTPMAVKPAPKRVAVADAAGGRAKAAAVPATATAASTTRFSTDVRFAKSSFWVSAAEMERLWSFSSRIKDTTGQLTVIGYAGNEGGMFSQAELSRKRAARVAELLQKNNPQVRFKVAVRTSTAGARHVQVSYSSSL